MLYGFLKLWVRLAATIFCRKIIINQPERLKLAGPMLLAANHPNSFFDAILLDILFKKPIWSLARGDVFKKPFYIKLLTKLKILPVYRPSEGVENLDINYITFDACKKIFQQNGLVLMFSEGQCINEWHLRPLKKGTARLAISSWQDGIDLHVLPVGINYSSFKRFGKNIFLNFGAVITKEAIDLTDTDGNKHLAFNKLLQHELEKLVFEIPPGDKPLQEKLLLVRPGNISRLLFFIPAFIGLLLNAPFYLPVRSFTRQRTNNTDHYDSVVMALLVLLYPFYLLWLTLLAWWITHHWLSLFLLLLAPFSGWCYTRLKKQLDG